LVIRRVVACLVRQIEIIVDRLDERLPVGLFIGCPKVIRVVVGGKVDALRRLVRHGQPDQSRVSEKQAKAKIQHPPRNSSFWLTQFVSPQVSGGLCSAAANGSPETLPMIAADVSPPPMVCRQVRQFIEPVIRYRSCHGSNTGSFVLAAAWNELEKTVLCGRNSPDYSRSSS